VQNDENICPAKGQTEAQIPEQPVADSSEQEIPAGDIQAPQQALPSPEILGLSSSACLVQQKQPKRKDKDHIHAMRHAVLSRYPLEALARLGENVKGFRRIERKFREELKPTGIVGAMLFDRFFSSYLRCVLAARAEAATFAPIDQPGEPRLITSLKERELPTLVLQDQDPVITSESLSPDLLRQLVLVARYDRHFAREMYRALGMLLVLRRSGQAGLEQCAEHMPGIQKENSGGS
jgi:hypothetical protein